ncbi:YqhG family protein [Bacillus piscicola]|uniref:YqhG family protein n=1 Tax=Bacillus piscicola TaxID=1632684 RepID=UPI001F090E81|nr:YqhG family protein [Bacillus piscicola]
MEQHVIHDFVRKYFITYGADILSENSRKLSVQLTEDLDEELMNRPFYWQFIRKTNGQAEPLQLTLLTDGQKQKKEDGEPVHFGSPRLHQLFRSAKEKGKSSRLYEEIQQIPGTKPVPLYPWLVMNIKISYVSHQRKDKLFSYGLQLIHGQIVDDMMGRLENKSLHPVISEGTFPMSSLIQTKSGILRIKRHLQQTLAAEPQDWADFANQRMQEELTILNAYYQHSKQTPEEYEQEKNALTERYQPEIIVEIINHGLFFLTASSF